MGSFLSFQNPLQTPCGENIQHGVGVQERMGAVGGCHGYLSPAPHGQAVATLLLPALACGCSAESDPVRTQGEWSIPAHCDALTPTAPRTHARPVPTHPRSRNFLRVFLSKPMVGLAGSGGLASRLSSLEEREENS